jgi:hypothetical protein
MRSPSSTTDDGEFRSAKIADVLSRLFRSRGGGKLGRFGCDGDRDRDWRDSEFESRFLHRRVFSRFERRVAKLLRPRRAPCPLVGSRDEAGPAARSRSPTGASRSRPSRRWAKTVFDADLRLLQSVAPITVQLAGTASAHPAFGARSGPRLARDNPAADGGRVGGSASRPGCSALADYRSALR